jgi:hypothetical protein
MFEDDRGTNPVTGLEKHNAIKVPEMWKVLLIKNIAIMTVRRRKTDGYHPG